MMGKYLKNVFITFGIITLAWANVSFVYRTKREISEMTEAITGLSSALDQSKQKEINAKSALNVAEDKIKNLTSQKVKEETNALSIQPKPATIVKTVPLVTKAPPVPLPVVVKPVVQTARPSRVSRAS